MTDPPEPAHRGLTDFLEEHPRFARSAAFAPRAARKGTRSLLERGRRLRGRIYFILQSATAAAVSWFIAERLLGHPQPFLALVATLIALGQSFGQRLERVIEIVAGVAIGVLVGDLVVTLLGAGYWQLVIIVAVAMIVATVLGAGVLMTSQAGVQAAFVTVIIPPSGMVFSRWIDAVVGGAVALVAATITPTSPIKRPRQHAAAILVEVAAILADIAAALRSRSNEAAQQALDRSRSVEELLDELDELAADGLAVVRLSPFRRRDLPGVQAVADLFVPLDRAIRNLRVLARRAVVAVDSGERVPTAYIDLIDDLGDATAAMARSLQVRRLPESARPALVDLAERTTHVASRLTLSSEVIRAQIRSMVIDLLRITGYTIAEAVDLVPDSFELDPPGRD